MWTMWLSRWNSISILGSLFPRGCGSFCHHNARKSLDSRAASLTGFFVFTINEYLPLTTVLLTSQQLKMCWKQRWRLPSKNWHIPSLFKQKAFVKLFFVNVHTFYFSFKWFFFPSTLWNSKALILSLTWK